jgi:hypothetical protein
VYFDIDEFNQCVLNLNWISFINGNGFLLGHSSPICIPPQIAVVNRRGNVRRLAVGRQMERGRRERTAIKLM